MSSLNAFVSFCQLEAGRLPPCELPSRCVELVPGLDAEVPGLETATMSAAPELFQLLKSFALRPYEIFHLQIDRPPWRDRLVCYFVRWGIACWLAGAVARVNSGLATCSDASVASPPSIGQHVTHSSSVT